MNDNNRDTRAPADQKPLNLPKPVLWIGFFLLSLISAGLVFIPIGLALSYNGENYPKQYHLPMALSPLLLLVPFFIRLSASSNFIKKRRILNAFMHALVSVMGAALMIGMGAILVPMIGDSDAPIFGIPFVFGLACVLSVNYTLFQKVPNPP